MHQHSQISFFYSTPFGSAMASRGFSSGAYRFGFNTQEKGEEIAKGHYTAEYWEYDSRLGRRWNLDPMQNEWETPKIVCTNTGKHKTKYTLTALLQNNTKEHVAQTIISLIKQIKIPIKTITSDNGLEFADHQVVQKTTNVKFYFAEPHLPWQRGLNENTKGLIGQFIPKGTLITKQELEITINNLNNRIKKKLNWKSPK